MRAHMTASRLAVFTAGMAALPVALGLAGCSSTANPPPTPGTSTTTSTVTSSATAAPTSGPGGVPTSVSVEAGNTINYGSVGTTATIPCENGKSLVVGGSNNTLTVTGTCETVNVIGTGNKITIEKVTGHVRIAGLDNTITYKDGDPTIENPLPGNTVTKGG
jgi:Protein of unknown function (DUF3060)